MLFDSVARWCEEHQDKVYEAILAPCADDIGLFVISRSEEYDFDLNEDLSEFAIELVASGLPVYTTLLPSCAPMEAGLSSAFGVFKISRV